MAAHARLNNEFREDEKNHNLMRWLKLKLRHYKRTNCDFIDKTRA